MIGTLREGFFQDAFFAGALNKVSDFEIVFEFKIFFCHWIPGIIFLLKKEGSNFELMFCNKQQKKSSLKLF
jgi:hypothetical protein